MGQQSLAGCGLFAARHPQKGRGAGLIAAATIAASVIPAVRAGAQEIELLNDSLVAGSTVAVCPCFTPTEEAAVWLTSPCNGNIVAIRIFWRSQFGGAETAIEDAIVVYEGGTFPVPGPVKDLLEGPALTDGGLNEFRTRDDNQTIPIIIPVTAGETFVVSLRFFNQNNNNLFAPSIVSDRDGATPSRNAVRVNGTTWRSNTQLGVNGDWVIRAVVDCTGPATGACCLTDGSCGVLTEAACEAAGGFYNGDSTTCATAACLGACFIPATGGCLQFNRTTCDAVGGQWQGPGTTACTAPCPADIDGNATLNVFDIFAYFGAFGTNNLAVADFNNDNTLNVFDIFAYFGAFGAGC